MKNIFEQIHSPQLLLRSLAITDASAVQQLLASNKEHMTPWIPWAGNEPETVEEKKAKIRIWKGEFYLDKTYVYGIFAKESNKIAGLCFAFTRQGEGILEIGYIIDHLHAGKGYATASSYALTKLSFQLLKAEKVLIICSEENIASAKIPKKLGFTLESTYKDIPKRADGSRESIMRWAMYQEDFEVHKRYEPIHFTQEEGW